MATKLKLGDDDGRICVILCHDMAYARWAATAGIPDPLWMLARRTPGRSCAGAVLVLAAARRRRDVTVSASNRPPTSSPMTTNLQRQLTAQSASLAASASLSAHTAEWLRAFPIDEGTQLLPLDMQVALNRCPLAAAVGKVDSTCLFYDAAGQAHTVAQAEGVFAFLDAMYLVSLPDRTVPALDLLGSGLKERANVDLQIVKRALGMPPVRSLPASLPCTEGTD
eukprot:s7257_g5.t1